MKQPGVYLEEIKAFPNSIVAATTTIPAFVGYTQKADNQGQSLLNKPWRIQSLTEFESYFGGAPITRFNIEELNEADTDDPDFKVGNARYRLSHSNQRYLLYYSVSQFFLQGGESCYIVSVGRYQQPIETRSLLEGIKSLNQVMEHALLLVPESTQLNDVQESAQVHQQMLEHCGAGFPKRFAIFDIWGGNLPCNAPQGNCIQNFRNATDSPYLNFGAAYYPWLNTEILESSNVNFQFIENTQFLQSMLTEELAVQAPRLPEPYKTQWQSLIASIGTNNQPSTEVAKTSRALTGLSPLYSKIMEAICYHINCLPPSGFVAGVFVQTDIQRNVWTAPANLPLNFVASPSVPIGTYEQEDLNVPLDGKAVNAIRSFVGRGVLIWGARTLDCNSADWRYINVRRTMIMLETSIQQSLKTFEFEPNDANTWTLVKTTIENFLVNLWKEGGLQGASPSDAFQVQIGLGQTMTADDLLNGQLIATIQVAIMRPGEFITSTFRMQLQQTQ